MRNYDLETLKREAHAGMIYKYRALNEDTYNTLEENHLWFAAPSEFNDAFDCQIPFASDSSLASIADYFVRSGYDRSHIEKILRTQSTPLEDLLRKHHSQPNFADDFVRVCCFSKRNDIKLMWSHYADKYKGICMGFDAAKDPKTFAGLPVEYVDGAEFPRLDIFSDEYALQRLIFTKSSDWKHEEEVRVCNVREGDKQLYKFKPESLTHIIFGSKVSKENIDRVLEIVKGRDVKLQKIQLAPPSLELKVLDF
ncbi:hypothetical protein GGR28_003422 [Lewinella aquimaris]|uniref:DUF2971 domain-containing protein n=1 Tax=Neolewinella aquimaris TaxID=1835722 RepID=A0A840EBG3_9BACT|nr:DUF2971 domain-containing protein [Neolewinella aquimaris]MBB4080787.1 hypothetical protein [Neolewinella aquimaris]